MASRVCQERWLPTPYRTIATFIRSISTDAIIAAQGGGRNGLAPHVLVTAVSFVVPTVTGLVAGLVAALGAVQFRFGRSMLGAVTLPWRVIPPLMVVPLILIMGGASWHSSWFAVWFYALVSFAPYAYESLSMTPNTLLELARVNGADSWWALFRVRAPWAIPLLIGPVKLVAGFCLGVVVIVEFAAAPEGIGRVMKFAISYTAVDLLMACILWVVLLGLAFDALVDAALGRITRWSTES